MYSEIDDSLDESIVEPSKILEIGDITIELCNEMIQMVNDELNLHFTTDANLVEIQDAFEGNQEIVYGEDSYKDYTKIIELSMRIEQDDIPVYHITLKQESLDIGDIEQVQYAINYAVNTMSDTEVLNCITIFPSWGSFIGETIKENTRVQYNGKLYKVIEGKSHKVQADWTPDIATSLYVEIADPSIEYPDFKQPSGAHDAYKTGDKVTYNGKHYISKIDNNVWSPDDYPDGWELVEQ